jgi:hypothetical protein
VEAARVLDPIEILANFQSHAVNAPRFSGEPKNKEFALKPKREITMTAACPLLTPNVEFLVALLEKTRGRMLELVGDLPQEKLLRVPSGFHNNLLWNLGHVLVSQQLLCYEKCGQPLRVPVYMVALFRKGTRPRDWTGQIDGDEVRTWLLETTRMLRDDLEKNRFGEYTPYETSLGLRPTITLKVCLSCKISPLASTVIFFDRSPVAMAVATSAMLRTCVVRLLAMELTESVRSFQVPATPRTSA